METRIVRGASAKQLLKAIKRDFGEDVTILSTRSISRDSRSQPSMVEMTIGIDTTDSAPIELHEALSSPSHTSTAIIEELSHLLERNGLTKNAASSLIEQYLAEADDDLSTLNHLRFSNAISNIMHFKSIGPNNRFIALLGQPGVGKTTTTCKLALRSLKLYPNEVGIISIDSDRRSQIIQVEDICHQHQIPLATATNPSQLKAAFSKMMGLRQVYIDCPGISSSGPLARSLLAQLLEIPNLYRMLLLPATGNCTDHERMISSLAPWGISAISVTKTDDTVHFGPCYSAISASNLPLAYLGTGRSIPEDLEIASGIHLSELLTRTFH